MTILKMYYNTLGRLFVWLTLWVNIYVVQICIAKQSNFNLYLGNCIST